VLGGPVADQLRVCDQTSHEVDALPAAQRDRFRKNDRSWIAMLRRGFSALPWGVRGTKRVGDAPLTDPRSVRYGRRPALAEITGGLLHTPADQTTAHRRLLEQSGSAGWIGNEAVSRGEGVNGS